MKRILALVLFSVMTISSTVLVSAEEVTGSKSPDKERIEELEKEVAAQNARIAALTQAIQAADKAIATASSGGSGNSSSYYSAPTSNGNSVSFSGSVAYQGGKVEINGGKSNVTFTIKTPSSTVMTSARSLAKDLGGTLVNCISTGSPGVAFKEAKVNFFVSGVTANDNIAVYQRQNGSWVPLAVTEIRQDHVVVNLTQHGDIAFIRVPVAAVVVG